ncbi:uncharacterized protein METZ01_LOCUS429098 [marine metagenome]|uniref:Uncharacterized protein n=1 Tax=marine metagenome TaxID=408172 RepID=A0A382XZA8_9ZZZZ
MGNRWKIFSGQTRPRYYILQEIGCEISIDEVIEAIVDGMSWEEYIGESWREMGSDWDCYGPTTLIDKCIQFEGDEQDAVDNYHLDIQIKEEVDVNLEEFYPEKTDLDDGDNNLGEDNFFLHAYGFEKGDWDYEAFEISENFNPKFIKPVFKENSVAGIVSHYLYNDKNSDTNIEIYGDFIESRGAVGGEINLLANTNKGLNKIWDLDDIRSEMEEKNLDSTNEEDVRNHLISLYDIKE